ncbi:peptidase MA family metallohydrolase [Paludisphaera borealis]|uniref:Peptidase MA-like domain-containing protein n=1 Tax=Paludisphaera borealis TaxID=1387353 RepID=A0A1U7CKY7_9BACT|nr:hypothetical protein [Paludisphaera borealis]APW59568.1 hypothetical protein BSF38_00995 [Paludisphaera borealis]
MRQVFWILTLATAVVVAVPQGSLKAAPGAKDAIAQARKQIASKNLKAAAVALEDALGDSRGDDRKAILDLLKQTYQSLIREAQAAGKTQEADLYTDDLAILEAQPGPSPNAAPAVVPAEITAPPSFEPTPVPEPAKTPAVPEIETMPTPKPAPKAAEPASVPRNDQPLDPRAFAEPDAFSAANTLPPLDSPGAGANVVAAPGKSAPPPPPAKAPQPLTVADEILPMRSARPSTRDDSLRTASNASQAEAPSPPAAAAPSKDLAAADALFNQKRYDQAGKLYAALAAKDRLPSARKKVWAYCRWAAVVARINAHPRTTKEWDDIEKEIQSVQVLTPGNWYGEYLRDRVTAARRGERPSGRAGSLVVRGAAPEEPEAEQKPQPPAPVDDRARRAGGEERLDLPSSTGDGDSANAPAPGQAAAPTPSASAPNWQIQETASFRIYHTDPALAEQAAETAEAVRARQGTRWASKGVHSPWTPRCDIYLYPTARDFARMTGQPETSPGFSTMGVSGDQIVARRVNLRADHPQVLSAILPHEVTHVVLADVFTDQQIPRWADEGMAVLAEPASEQAGRASDLNAPLAEHRLFKLSQLMAIDYPEAKHWNLFYAQSVSLTQFLVRQGTAAQFVAFVKSSQRKGPETALREVYRFEGFDDLETRWSEYARQQASQVATADASAPADSPSPRLK